MRAIFLLKIDPIIAREQSLLPVLFKITRAFCKHSKNRKVQENIKNNSLSLSLSSCYVNKIFNIEQ